MLDLKQSFKKLKQDLGLSLIELTVVLAITGLITVPLTAIFRLQLRLPEKVASEISAARQIQKSTLILIGDAQAAKAFDRGVDPEYGTFSWVELAGPQPVPVTSLYFFEIAEEDVKGEALRRGQVKRKLTRGGGSTSSIIILDGISSFDQVDFVVEDPLWNFDSATNSWSYTEGKVTVSIRQLHEAGAEFGEETLTETLVANYRPQSFRPVALPPPG